MFDDIGFILTSTSVEDVWRRYVRRMGMMGFPHVSYNAARILAVAGERLLDDGILLSNYAPRMLQEILDQGSLENMPMYRWLKRNKGSESWDWMHRRRQAGRLTPDEERMLDLFARYGHVAGYAIGLGDSVARVQAGALVTGPVGVRQDKLDALWHQHRSKLEALTAALHLRVSTLPYTAPSNVLTQRQREVLEHVAIGRTTPEVAEFLDLTSATVEKHLRLARKALGARTTAQAVLLAASRQQIFGRPATPPTVADSDPDEAAPWRFAFFPPPQVGGNAAMRREEPED